MHGTRIRIVLLRPLFLSLTNENIAFISLDANLKRHAQTPGTPHNSSKLRSKSVFERHPEIHIEKDTTMTAVSYRSSKLCITLLFLLLSTFSRAQYVPRWETIVEPSNIRHLGADTYEEPRRIATRDAVTIYYLNNALGYQTVQSTTNGGKSWSTTDCVNVWKQSGRKGNLVIQNMQVSGESCVFLSGHESEYITSTSGQSGNMRHGAILYSMDNATTWKHCVFDSNTRVSNLCMIDSLRGFACLTMTDSPLLVNGYRRSALLCRTSNAWTSYTTMALPDSILYASVLRAFSDSDLVLIGYDLATKATVCCRSENGGAGWQVWPCEAARPSVVSMNTFYALSNDYLSNYSAPTFCTLRKSTDGGRSFYSISSLEPDDNGLLYRCTFIDESNGILSGTNQSLYKTTDGGSHWTRMQTDLPYCYDGAIKDLMYPMVDRAVAVFNENALLCYNSTRTLESPTFVSPDLTDRRYLTTDPISFSWTSNISALSYQLQISEYQIRDNNVWDPKAFDFPTLSLFTNDTVFIYPPSDNYTGIYARVRSLNATDTSAWRTYNCMQSLRCLVDSNKTMPPRIYSPRHGSIDVAPTTTFRWDAVPGAIRYEFQCATTEANLSNGNFVLRNDQLQQNSIQAVLAENTVYVSRVRAFVDSNTTTWSSSFNQHIIRTTHLSTEVHSDPLSDDAAWQIHPNPAYERAYLRSRLEGMLNTAPEWRIINSLGQVLTPWTRGSVLDLSSIPVGRYIVQCREDQRITALPLLVIHP